MWRVCIGATFVLLVSVSAFADERPPTVPMTFAHIDHREQNCIVCHHNFADTTGQGLCIDCHVRDPELRRALEAQFHELCRGCHVERRRDGEEGGPPRRCFDCHHIEDAP